MICEKTGAVVYLEQYGEAVRGDAFRLGDHLLIRVNNKSRGYQSDVHHYRVGNVCNWFDENAPIGTIIADSFVYHGYDGEVQ